MSMFGGSSRKESESKSAESTASAEELVERIRELEDSVNKLNNVNKAMWRVIEEGFGIDMESLRYKLAEVEAEEEKVEGSTKKKAKLCANCGRPLTKKATNCQYCGHPVSADDVFDII